MRAIQPFQREQSDTGELHQAKSGTIDLTAIWFVFSAQPADFLPGRAAPRRECLRTSLDDRALHLAGPP